jgi:hypothetical protein
MSPYTLDQFKSKFSRKVCRSFTLRFEPLPNPFIARLNIRSTALGDLAVAPAYAPTIRVSKAVTLTYGAFRSTFVWEALLDFLAPFTIIGLSYHLLAEKSISSFCAKLNLRNLPDAPRTMNCTSNGPLQATSPVTLLLPLPLRHCFDDFFAPYDRHLTPHGMDTGYI